MGKKNILTSSRWIILAIVISLFATGTAFAEGTIQALGGNYKITKLDGSLLETGKNIEFIFSSQLPPPTQPGPEKQTLTKSIGGGDPAPNQPGTFNFFFAERGAVLIRAWEGDIGQSNYGYTSTGFNADTAKNETLILPEPPNPPPTFKVNFSTKYKCEVPPAPMIGEIVVGFTTNLEPKATINLTANTGHHELSGDADYNNQTYWTKIWDVTGLSEPEINQKVSGSPADLDYHTNGSFTTKTGDLSLSKTYAVKACVHNWFGYSNYSAAQTFEVKGLPAPGKAKELKIKLNADGSIDLSWKYENANAFQVYQSVDNGKSWEDITSKLAIANKDPETKKTTISNPPAKAYYQVRASGAGFADEIVGKITFPLKKIAGKTGINSIAIPFDTAGDAVEGPVIAMNAQAMAESMGAPFETIGRWEAAEQTTYGLTKTAEGFVGTNFEIKKDVGYQVSVSEDKNWTVVGQVSGKI